MTESFNIQISSNLVKHLLDDDVKLVKKTKKPKSKTPRSPQRSGRISPSDDSETFEGAKWPLQPPLFLPVPPPQQNVELDAIRAVLAESEKVVEKFQKQEETLLKEVTQRARELHEKEFKLPSSRPMPCLDENEACFKCYKVNVDDPLKCAGVVKSFEDCARRVRQQL